MDDHERSVTDIERQMNITTQQYLIGQVASQRVMIDLHEKELLLVWGAVFVIACFAIADNVYLRKQVKELSHAQAQ
jgi:hypothetical protein